MNTYPWIKATAISNALKISNIGDLISILTGLKSEKFLKRLKRRWPATMLAESRIDKVIGRIIFLTSSIRTIKFINIIGVPVGTVWAIIFFTFFAQPNNIIDIQIIKAVGKDIIICALGVKTKGDKAIKFVDIINKKILRKKIVKPFLLLADKRGFNSLNIFSLTIPIKFENLLELKNFLFKVKVIGNKRVIQAILNLRLEGSNIENKFIIIFIYLFLIIKFY